MPHHRAMMGRGRTGMEMGRFDRAREVRAGRLIWGSCSGLASNSRGLWGNNCLGELAMRCDAIDDRRQQSC
jgi:hypothetical protein